MRKLAIIAVLVLAPATSLAQSFEENVYTLVEQLSAIVAELAELKEACTPVESVAPKSLQSPEAPQSPLWSPLKPRNGAVSA